MKDAVARLTEESLYEQVASEIATGVRRDGLWAKAIVECGGSPERARAIYIKLRVQSLLDEAELKRLAKLDEQRQTEAEARTQEQERIDRRVSELREQEQKATAIPAWLVGLFVVFILVIIGKMMRS